MFVLLQAAARVEQTNKQCHHHWESELSGESIPIRLLQKNISQCCQFYVVPILTCLKQAAGIKHEFLNKPTPKKKNNTDCATCHLRGTSTRTKQKSVTFTNSFLIPGLLFLLALLFEIKMDVDAGRILLGGGVEKNNKQINNSHGCYFMNLRPGWRELMRALTGRVLQINGQAGAAV